MTASKDATARIWNVETGEMLTLLTGHSNSVNSVTFSPNGRRVLTNSSDKTMRLWDAETSQTLKVLNGHVEAVSSAVFSSDG